MSDVENSESRIPLPPASFTFLVLSMRAQAEMQLGMMSFADEEKPEKNLDLAPASFTFLVLSMRAQAEMQLGMMSFADEEKPEKNLDLARHTIDLMACLQHKTKGNLSLEEQRLLDNSVTELRFRFVQAAEEADTAESQKA